MYNCDAERDSVSDRYISVYKVIPASLSGIARVGWSQALKTKDTCTSSLHNTETKPSLEYSPLDYARVICNVQEYKIIVIIYRKSIE